MIVYLSFLVLTSSQQIPPPVGPMFLPAVARESTIRLSISPNGFGRTFGMRLLNDTRELWMQRTAMDFNCLLRAPIADTDDSRLSRITILTGKQVGFHYETYLANAWSWECSVPMTARQIPTTAELRWHPVVGTSVSIGWRNGPIFGLEIIP